MALGYIGATYKFVPRGGSQLRTQALYTPKWEVAAIEDFIQKRRTQEDDVFNKAKVYEDIEILEEYVESIKRASEATTKHCKTTLESIKEWRDR